MKKRLKKLAGKVTNRTDADDVQPQEGMPRITNETVAEHREEVLGRARKYILPLQHSKHRIITISIALFIAALVAFFTYCTLALYRFQSNSTFLYRVTQVMPFPVARSGSNFVSYENYLFGLRHYMHYYENQQELDFDSDAGQLQLAEFKRRALDKVVDDAYVKRLAKQHGITVSNQEVDDQITIVRNQNRLGGSEQVLEDVLKEFWGWSLDDFKRSLRQQLLAQKVVAALDTETQARADAALTKLKAGADFADVAKEYSDDQATKDRGGSFGFAIQQSDRNLTAQTTDALFGLKEGEYSGIINIGYALEIVRVEKKGKDTVEGAHILINFKDVDTYINDLKAEQPTNVYIKLQPAETKDESQPATQPAEG